MLTTRRALVAGFASLFGVKLNAQLQTSVFGSLQVLEDGTILENGKPYVSPEEKPELYWEVVWRCPNGHTNSRYVLREGFDEDAIRNEQHYSYCMECHAEWLKRNFPPTEYLAFKPIDVKAMKKRGSYVIW